MGGGGRHTSLTPVYYCIWLKYIKVTHLHVSYIFLKYIKVLVETEKMQLQIKWYISGRITYVTIFVLVLRRHWWCRYITVWAATNHIVTEITTRFHLFPLTKASVINADTHRVYRQYVLAYQWPEHASKMNPAAAPCVEGPPTEWELIIGASLFACITERIFI